MPFRRAALLTTLACLLVVAPAAASERSEARQYAAAMDGLADLTPAEVGEAVHRGSIQSRAGSRKDQGWVGEIPVPRARQIGRAHV